MDERELFIRAIQLWGSEAQIDMMIEEMSELTKELCKYRRGKVTNIIEEIADVQIMLKQMLVIFGDVGYQRIYQHKLEYLQSLIEETDR